MGSIDLFADFNDEADARAGDDDEDDNPDRPDRDEDNEENNEDGDGAKEDVEAKVKVVRVKRKLHTLNMERLQGPRGIAAIDDFFTDIKFKGKGYEKQDLNDIMKRMEHWAHRMYPKYTLDDSLSAIERLSKKKEFSALMTRYRRDELGPKDDDRVLSDDDEAMNISEAPEVFDEPMNEFDALIDEQIALSRTNGDKSFGNMSSISGIANHNDNIFSSTHMTHQQTFSSQPSSSHHTMTQPSQPSLSHQMTTQPSQPPQQQTQVQETISDEVRARIADNKRRAMAIREQREKEAAEKLKQMELEEKKKEIEEKNKQPKVVPHITTFIDDDF